MIADCDPARPPALRIVTWNVNSLRVRLPRVLEVLAEHPHRGDRLCACGIDRGYRTGTKPSDHAPLLVDLAGAAQ